MHTFLNDICNEIAVCMCGCVCECIGVFVCIEIVFANFAIHISLFMYDL